MLRHVKKTSADWRFILHPLKLRWRWRLLEVITSFERRYTSGKSLKTSWWLNQPIWKILVKLDHFPRVRGENKKCLKPPLGKMVVFFIVECWFWRGLLSWIPYDSFLYRGTFHSNTHKWSPSGPTKQIWTRKLLLKCTGTHLRHLWCCHCTNDGPFTARSARSRTYRRPERWPLILLAAKSRREDLQ